MAMIDIQHPFYCPIRPLVNIFFPTSAANPAVTAEMPENVFITVGTIVVKVTFARVITEEHRVYFLDLLLPKLRFMEKVYISPNYYCLIRCSLRNIW